MLERDGRFKNPDWDEEVKSTSEALGYL